MAQRARRFCVYCNPQDINDATFHYVDLIRRGLVRAGREDLGVTRDTAVLRAADEVVTISCQLASVAALRHPAARLLHWFQGIEAVERRHIHGGLKGWSQFVAWTALERWLLRRARMKFFVSDEMRRLLGDRVGAGQQSLVIPCYNVPPPTDGPGDPQRYGRLHLVYAGSLFKWQCVEHVLLTYRVLKRQHPDARLSLFTREVERAQALCAAHGLTDVEIRSLSPQQLVEALRACSHGFILREHMAINEVSTPTKLSTYLAAGVMPVLTTATPALVRAMAESPYKVVVDQPGEHERIAQALSRSAAEAPTAAQVQTSYATVFARHFADETYVARIAEAACAL